MPLTPHICYEHFSRDGRRYAARCHCTLPSFKAMSQRSRFWCRFGESRILIAQSDKEAAWIMRIGDIHRTYSSNSNTFRGDSSASRCRHCPRLVMHCVQMKSTKHHFSRDAEVHAFVLYLHSRLWAEFH